MTLTDAENSPLDPETDTVPTAEDSDRGEGQEIEEHKEPSLGPACFVVAILSLATFCAVCGFGSWFMFRDQYPLAERSIQQQLIPWVQSSQLSIQDKKSVIQQLEALMPMLRERTIDKLQLTRLHNCLRDNPVLLWGAVEAIHAQAANSDLTETEHASLKRVSQRLLRAAAIRKLGRNDIEYAIQNCARVRSDKQSLEVVGTLTTDQIREFMQRAEQLVEKNDIPNEPYDKTPAKAFAILVDSALTVD